MQSLLIGADPELFVKNKETNEFISAHTLIPGTKNDPFKVPFGAIQVDGTALEFNIEPVSSGRQFRDNINSLISYLKQEVEKDETRSLCISPCAHFLPSYISRLPPDITALGCSPDFNAYRMCENTSPSADVSYRTASGHVHIGWTSDHDPWDPEHFKLCASLTKQLDIALFIPSLLFDPDNQRRELYGKQGAFRPKPYGMEYRVLSNQWITSDHLIEWVYETTIRATQDLSEGFEYSAFVTEKQINHLALMVRHKTREKAIHKLAAAFPFIQLP